MEADDEVKGTKNSYDFGARLYDPRVGRWLSIDPLAAKYPDLNPYNFVANSPVQGFDPDGKLIIWINGEAAKEEKADISYWGSKKVNNFQRKIDDPRSIFKNGDQTLNTAGIDLPANRTEEGKKKAIADFESIKRDLKENSDGKITETIKIVSHSKGGAYANGYAEELDAKLAEWRESEPELFEGEGGKIELVVHLAPHQSNYIDVADSDYPTITVSHSGDILSDDDATGDVANILTETPSHASNSHTISGFWKELDKIWEKHTENKKNNVTNKYNGMSGLLDNQVNYTREGQNKKK